MVYWPNFDSPFYLLNQNFDDFEITRWSKSKVLKMIPLFRQQGISQFDVSNLGTSYNDLLGSAMVAIASRKPHLIERLFVNKAQNQEGIYGVSLYVKGKPWVISVDDTFFVNSKTQ